MLHYILNMDENKFSVRKKSSRYVPILYFIYSFYAKLLQFYLNVKKIQYRQQ